MFQFSASTTVLSGMPIWYSPDRELELHKSLGREVIENLIKQRVEIYKVDISNTDSNFYGENIGEKLWLGPYIIIGRVQISDQSVELEGGIRRLGKGDMILHVYDDHLTETGLEIRIGDFVKFNNKFYEVFDNGVLKSANKRRLGVDYNFYRTFLCHVVSYDIFSGK